MPNGDPHFDIDELDRFFSPFQDVIENSAKKHNLLIKKYYHDSPSLDLTFRHPRGGIGKIDIIRKDDEHVYLREVWWFDDYDSLKRSIKRIKREPIQATHSEVETEIEAALAEILSWEFGKWDEEHGGYGNWRSTWTKAQFYELEMHYPLPIP